MNKKIHFASNLACGNTATHRPRVHGIFFTANAEKVTCTKCIAALA